MAKVQALISVRPNYGIGLKAEEALIAQYGAVLWNTGNDQRELAAKYPDLFFIIRIFGWTPNPLDAYNRFFFYREGDPLKNIIYYNCGFIAGEQVESGYEGTLCDEMGTSGKVPLERREYNYGKSQQHFLDVRKYMPELKILVTHPNNIIKTDHGEVTMFPLVETDIWAFHISYIPEVMQNWYKVPEGVKLAAYIAAPDFDRPDDELRGIGSMLNGHDIHLLLYNDKPDLWVRMAPARPALSEKGKIILKGLQ